MTNSYIIDSYGWIEYLDGTVKGTKVRDIVENRNNKIYTCTISIAEIVSKFIRKGLEPVLALRAITSASVVIDVDTDLSTIAGETHARIKSRIKDFGLADAYVLTCSIKYDAKVVTGDPHFKSIKGVVFI
ncbi:MAG: putative nucleic acid-binding protein [Candidatus Nitrosomirales archaeon]|jgi:predicted nucleic acid-binding protein